MEGIPKKVENKLTADLRSLNLALRKGERDWRELIKNISDENLKKALEDFYRNIEGSEGSITHMVEVLAFVIDKVADAIDNLHERLEALENQVYSSR